MDPLTAISLSASVVQFVSFASQLISKTKEVHESVKGCASQVITLETVYGQLQALSLRLESSSERDPRLKLLEGTTDFVKHIFAINDLSRSCKEDCNRLLEIVRKLKAEEGSKHRWQSFRIALKTVWKGNEIADLQQSLHHTQATLTLQLCALTSCWQGAYQRQLNELRMESQRLDSQQSAKLDEIAKILSELDARIAVSKSEPLPNPFTPADISSLESQMSQLSLSKAAVAKEHLLLKSLSFDSRPVRYSSIPEAHKQTFGWVFKEPGYQGTHSTTGNLLTWLEKGDGIFWVSGKPGSGKSTLMKFVTNHPRTLKALSGWSHPKPAISASHYFWSAGTPMQKSQQGLLQTLLYEIFRQVPDLIELACVERWPKTIEELSHEAWLVPELHRVLQRIANRDSLSVKFCFFIDGLDEFEGDHVDFCLALQDLSKSPHVKLFVSSRPWNVFEDSFGRDISTKLYIHELTRNDIRSYVESRLQGHPRWKDLDVEATNATWLIDEITERATGVFLWVFLVTRQLRNGLTEYDSFSDMRRRLEYIPTDLEVFFKQMLESVESFYHEKMATTLKISLAAREPAPAAIYYFHDVEYEDEEYALNLPLKALGKRQAAARRSQISRRLNGWCRGLLEVNKHSGCVEFLHRTVMDFLRTREMSNFLARKAPSDFNPNISLLKAFTAYIKSTKFSEHVDRTGFTQHTASGLMFSLKEGLFHAKELGETAGVYELLDELERCIPEMNKRGQARLNVWGIPSNPVSLFFREQVVEDCLARYLHHQLPRQPNYFSDFENPVLSYVVSSIFAIPLTSSQRGEKIEMLQCLLEHDCDPNAAYYDPIYSGGARRTPWADLVRKGVPSNLTTDVPQSTSTGEFKWILESGLLSLMLEHGADPNALVYRYQSPRSQSPRSQSTGSHLTYTTAWIDLTFVSFHIPPESSYQVLYLQTLDDFIASGADLNAPMSSPVFGGLESPEDSTLSVFFDRLSQTSGRASNRVHCHLLAEVAERFLSMAKKAEAQVDCYWPVIEKAFPAHISSRLRNINLGVELKTRNHSLCTSNEAPKRILGDLESGEFNCKKARLA